MNKREFDKLFEGYSDTDTIQISRLREMLVVPDEKDPRTTKFLNSKIKYYEFDQSQKSVRQRWAMIKNIVFKKFGPDVTFRGILENEFFPEGWKKERQAGAKTYNLLLQTYKDNGVEDIYMYKK